MMESIQTNADEVRVYDQAGLDALPVGAKLNAALGRTDASWPSAPDPDAYWIRQKDGWHLVHGDGRVVAKAYRSSGLFFRGFHGSLTRRVLNPEILGEFHA